MLLALATTIYKWKGKSGQAYGQNAMITLLNLHAFGSSDGVAVTVNLGTGQNVSFENTLLSQCVFVVENVFLFKQW